MPKDKKGKKGKKGKNKVPKVSYYQAITSYKITVKENELIECNDELKKLREINQNLAQRNQRLELTRNYNFNKATDEYKTYNRDVNSRKLCTRDEVLQELKDLWRFKLSEEKSVLSLKRDLKKLDREINENKNILLKWTEFRDDIQYKLSTQINLLKKELEDMNENYQIISSSIQNNLVQTVERIKLNTKEVIQKKNKTAAQMAFNHMDKSVIEMSHENRWMEHQIEIFKQELAEAEETASNLEKENINLMAYLFECNNEEVKCIKSIFDFQFLDNENLEDNSIMNVDLNDINYVRPESALGLSMKKLKEIEFKTTPRSIEMLQIQAVENSEDDFADSSKLNQSARLLCLYGTKKELVKSHQHQSKKERDGIDENSEFNMDSSYHGENWPITQSMLKDILNS